MFVDEDVNHSDPDLIAVSSSAYGILRAASAPFADADTSGDVEIAVWSLVHGYAMLGFKSREGRYGALSRVPDFDQLLLNLVGNPLALPPQLR
jgi:hypothetical protein